jgi:3-dehydroquinate synthetase
VEFQELIFKFFPNIQIGNIDSKKLVEGLKRDKKTINGKINFAIVKNVGELVIVEKAIDQELVELVEEYLDEFSKLYSS